MTIDRFFRSLRYAIAGVLLSAGAAQAATLTEGDMPGGAFGASWDKPTVVGAGITGIVGTGSQNAFDNFVLTGLPGGAQDITFLFTAPEGIGWSYSAGGNILYSLEPFAHGWDGKGAGVVQLDWFRREQSLVLSLGEEFSGTLYLALNFTHGANLGYAIGLPGAAGTGPSPAPVPVPAGMVLLGSGLMAFGVLHGAGGLRPEADAGAGSGRRGTAAGGEAGGRGPLALAFAARRGCAIGPRRDGPGDCPAAAGIP
jgi:hypothetical protein